MSLAIAADLRLKRGSFVLDARFDALEAGVSAVFGPSGAGKSMLLMALAGLERLDAGRVVVRGRVLDDIQAGLRTPAHRRGIGLVFQDGRLFPHLSVRGNLAYASKRAGNGPVSLADAASFFDIVALLDRPVRNLSGGERSRVALARSILAAPDILLLDEPFAALDGSRRRTFLKVLREMADAFSIPMMVVTHQIDDVAALADHVVGMRNGAVVAAGPAQRTVAEPAFQSLLDSRDTGAVVRIEQGFGKAGAAWVRADHVLIANAPPSGLSARHVWPARVAGILAEGATSVLVRLETEVGGLYARVTPAAAADLQLADGAAVWAVVKTHSL